MVACGCWLIVVGCGVPFVVVCCVLLFLCACVSLVFVRVMFNCCVLLCFDCGRVLLDFVVVRCGLRRSVSRCLWVYVVDCVLLLLCVVCLLLFVVW